MSTLKITQRSSQAVEDCDWRDAITIELENIKLSFCDGEPEDSNLSREFKDVYKISELILLGNELGLKGHKIEIVNEESDEI